MPEWLRGLTRNQMRFPRVGSNPTGDDQVDFYNKLLFSTFETQCQKQSRLPGVEPGIFCSVGRRVAIAPQPLDGEISSMLIDSNVKSQTRDN